ncbi:MAG: hypothetical protein AABX38_00765 [Candidatus Micrarchaeota archaeon]
MNVSGILVKLNKFSKLFTILLFLMGFATITYAGGLTGVNIALFELCKSAKTMLGIAVVLLVVMSAVIYAVGQLLGAETRARATVWATAMFTGAIIGVLIYIIIPTILASIVSNSGNVNGLTLNNCA